MQLYKRNGVYQVTYQSGDGKQVRRSLKTRNKRLADKLIAKLCLDLYECSRQDPDLPQYRAIRDSLPSVRDVSFNIDRLQRAHIGITKVRNQSPG